MIKYNFKHILLQRKQIYSQIYIIPKKISLARKTLIIIRNFMKEKERKNRDSELFFVGKTFNFYVRDVFAVFLFLLDLVAKRWLLHKRSNELSYHMNFTTLNSLISHPLHPLNNVWTGARVAHARLRSGIYCIHEILRFYYCPRTGYCCGAWRKKRFATI